MTSTYFLWLRAVKYCKPTVLSVGMNLNFINTIIWSVLLLHKWPSLGETSGGVLILFSIVSGTFETCYQPTPSPAVEVGGSKGMESERKDLLKTPSIQAVQGLVQQQHSDLDDTHIDAKILKY